jgi:hypothetical protein
MKKPLLIITAILALQLSGNATAREFGPEWKKVTFSNSNYVEYQRKVEISATHAGIGNSTNYPLDLEHHSLNIFELDDNLGVNIHIRDYGEFSLAKDLQGKPESYTVALGPVRYFDLNGDGYIDARYDGHKEVSEIFFQGQYLAVQTTRTGVKSPTRTSLDGNTQYIFSHGKWVVSH